MQSEYFVVIVIIFVIIATLIVRDVETIVMTLSVINASIWFYIGSMKLEAKKMELESKFKSQFASSRVNVCTDRLNSCGGQSTTTCDSKQGGCCVGRKTNGAIELPINADLIQNLEAAKITSNPDEMWRKAPLKKMGLLHTPAFTRTAAPVQTFDERAKKLQEWRVNWHKEADVKAKRARSVDTLSRFYEKDLKYNEHKDWWETM